MHQKRAGGLLYLRFNVVVILLEKILLKPFNHFLPGKEVKKQLLHMMITYFHSKILLNLTHVLQLHVLWARINPTAFPPHKPYLYRARIYLNRREVGHMFPHCTSNLEGFILMRFLKLAFVAMCIFLISTCESYPQKLSNTINSI